MKNIIINSIKYQSNETKLDYNEKNILKNLKTKVYNYKKLKEYSFLCEPMDLYKTLLKLSDTRIKYTRYKKDGIHVYIKFSLFKYDENSEKNKITFTNEIISDQELLEALLEGKSDWECE